jgi:hypothetical protein
MEYKKYHKVLEFGKYKTVDGLVPNINHQNGDLYTTDTKDAQYKKDYNERQKVTRAKRDGKLNVLVANKMKRAEKVDAAIEALQQRKQKLLKN